MEKTTFTNQLKVRGYDSKQIKHFYNLLYYRKIKISDIKYIWEREHEIYFFTNFDDEMVVAFAK